MISENRELISKQGTLIFRSWPSPPAIFIESTSISIETTAGPIRIFSCYASTRVLDADIEAILLSDESVIAAGDFKAHHVDWYCNGNNASGRVIQAFLDGNFDCSIIAPSQPTCFHHPASPRVCGQCSSDYNLVTAWGSERTS